MRIVKFEDLHADGGWRPFSFLKLTTDEGIVGWSEFSETGWNPGLTNVIRKLGRSLEGEDPRRFAALSAQLTAQVRMAAGGANAQAIAAIENAMIDVAAKAAGVPVHALFGGPYRDRVRVYWSHCGSFRVRNAKLFEDLLGTAPIRGLEDFTKLGKEAVARGFSALKTNPVEFTAQGPKMFNPGFTPQGLDLGHNAETAAIDAIADQIAAFREGVGPQFGLLLDLNFAYRPHAMKLVAKALEPYRLFWLEMDVHEPDALALVRQSTSTPVASLETLYGRRAYRPYFQKYAVDAAVVDVPWNGMAEAVKIAALAESFEINVAPHNFTGPLADLISAHFCASVPNIRIMEIEVDDVPWKADLLTVPPVLDKGEILVPTAPGWGADINEEAVKAHPVKGPVPGA